MSRPRGRRAVHTVVSSIDGERRFADKRVALVWLRAYVCLYGRESATYARRFHRRPADLRLSDRDAEKGARRILARLCQEVDA